MANTFVLIEAQTLGSSAASITLGSGGTIPQTYTDLKVVFSPRHTTAEISNDVQISFNGNTSNFTGIRVYGDGSAVSTDTNAMAVGTTPGSTATANTFGSNEIYIPSYTSANYKSFLTNQIGERNAVGAYQILTSNLWYNTAPITSITLNPGAGSFVQHSTFYLYGIKNS